MRKRRVLRRNDRFVTGAGGLDYIATLINPRDHRLYDIVYRSRNQHVYVTNPQPNEEYANPNLDFAYVGVGYFDETDEIEYKEEPFYRSHTPGGVSEWGRGFGLMLYSGLALAVYDRTNGYGIYSITGDRREPAESWWQSQLQRGFAVEGSATGRGEGKVEVPVDEDMIDMCELTCDARFLGAYPEFVEVTVEYELDIEFQVLPAERVMDQGWMLAWIPGMGLDNVMEESDFPPSEVLLGLDLSTVSDPILLINLLERLKRDESISVDQLQRFARTFPEAVKHADSETLQQLLRQKEFPYEEIKKSAKKELVANRRIRHDKAWKDYFGKFAEPVDETI